MGNDAVAANGRPTAHPRILGGIRLAMLLAVVAVAMTGVSCIGEDDLTLDQRHRGLSEQLMCPVCDSQTIDQSSAAVAEDMKAVIWQQLEAGESNEAIRSYFVARYGEAVLASPSTAGFNLTAWTFPALLAVVGMVAVGMAYLRMRLPERLVSRRAVRAASGASDGAGGTSGEIAADIGANVGEDDPELTRYLDLVDEEMRKARGEDASVAMEEAGVAPNDAGETARTTSAATAGDGDVDASTEPVAGDRVSG